jgi:hypothetical protein
MSYGLIPLGPPLVLRCSSGRAGLLLYTPFPSEECDTPASGPERQSRAHTGERPRDKVERDRQEPRAPAVHTHEG